MPNPLSDKAVGVLWRSPNALPELTWVCHASDHAPKSFLWLRPQDQQNYLV
ncbi:MAG: hypothetical protein ACFB12_22345 [Leptolyngbyaceae cyanobacterium]